MELTARSGKSGVLTARQCSCCLPRGLGYRGGGNEGNMKLISAKRPMKPVARGGANRDDVILVVCYPRSRGPVVRETGAHSSACSSLIHGQHLGNMAGGLPVASVHRKCD